MDLSLAGFDHAAYALRGEAHLDNSPNVNVAIPRGEIVALLRKSMLFVEAEGGFNSSKVNIVYLVVTTRWLQWTRRVYLASKL